jgi:hypothetical protein
MAGPLNFMDENYDDTKLNSFTVLHAVACPWCCAGWETKQQCRSDTVT